MIPHKGRFPLLRGFARDFLSFAGRDGWKAGFLVFAGALVEGIGLLLLLPLLGLILGASAVGGTAGSLSVRLLDCLPASTRDGQLLALLAIFALLMALRALILLKRDVLLIRLQVRFVESRRMRIISLLASSRWDFVVRLRHGRVTHILGSDIYAIRTAVLFLLQTGVAAIMLAGQGLLALLLSPPLALMLFVLLVSGGLALRPLLRRSRAFGAAITEANLGLVSTTSQFLGGLKLALSQGLERGFVAEFGELLDQGASREIAFARQRSIASIALTGLAALVAAVALVAGTLLLDTPAATLLALLVVVARMNGPASQIQQGAQQIVHSLPAYAKLKGLEDELAAAQRAPAPAQGSTTPIGGEIAFDSVTFRHLTGDNESEGGLSSLDLAISEGAFIGVAGASGAGKTTFADLLVGLYPPQAGRVTVGGQPLEGETLAAWRGAISYVSQDPFLFHDTIRRNLLWARPNATEDEMWQALELAGAGGLVRRMPEGLETLVGERGTLVSGGERQRLALARALLRRPRLLLLDEATNAIDVEGEAELLGRLRDMPDRPTVVTIAHRASSLSCCERIIEFAGGRIVSDRRR